MLTKAPPTLSPRSVCTSTTLLRPVRKFHAHSSFLLCYSASLGGTRGAGSLGGGEECFILPSLTLKGWLLWFPSLGGALSVLLCCPSALPSILCQVPDDLSLKAQPSLVIISFQEISPVCPVWSITFVPKPLLWRRSSHSSRWLFPCLSH